MYTHLNWFSWYWLAWILAFLVPELSVIAMNKSQYTLSDTVWAVEHTNLGQPLDFTMWTNVHWAVAGLIWLLWFWLSLHLPFGFLRLYWYGRLSREGTKMAYPYRRSCNENLVEGMTDGSYKKAAMDRGGFIEDLTADVRREMSGLWHGFNETNPKCLPDGTTAGTPNYHKISPRDMENV